jgi:hypothetical protein
MIYRIGIGLGLLLSSLVLAQDKPATRPSGAVEGGYAIVVAKSTLNDKDWAPVVQKLQSHYPDAKVICFEKSVSEARPQLAALMPRYTCFVGKNTEVGRVFCAEVHRLTRALNSDPWTDTVWGIITGYTPEDAIRLASLQQPLVLRRAVGCGVGVGPFEQAADFSDGQIGITNLKKADGTVDRQDVGQADRALAFARAVTTIKPDYMGSDGHATERDLQMPCGKGSLRCREGKIFALDHEKRIGYMMDSKNPKVYVAFGNCLIGHIDGPDAIALAFIHSLGVNQFVGYTVVTWYGKGGWGVNDWMFGQQGRWNLSESHFINHQFLLWELRQRFPQHADFNITPKQYEGHGDINGIASAIRSADRDELGMLWDRDTVVLWGDPAWDARCKPIKEYQWEQTLKREGNQFTLTVTPNQDGKIGRVFAFLPRAMGPATVTQGAQLKPVVGAWFVMVPEVGDVKKNTPVVIQFTAEEAKPQK